VDHAIGSLERPMTDAMLARKFHDQADPVLGASQVEALIQACWGLGQASSVRALVDLARARQ
ncbi:MAG: MmgE/PrpD family protein, partial [Betaproteobacteria bacterium]|nr:MmgE/PrpD family protein [Betaproteobacteria bacterium]